MFRAACRRPRRSTLSAFNELRGKSEATGTFVIEGIVHSYGVDLAGSTLKHVKLKDGRKMHYLRLEGEDGTRTIVWLTHELTGTSQGTCVRRIRYRDAATETVYTFLTTEMILPPGLIAFLYKMRWDIEKVFDETKNKFNERKAWASSLCDKTQQALLLCMAHNLMRLLERTLEREEGIVDEKSCRKRAKRMRIIEETFKEKGDLLNPLVSGLFRVTQRSLQFIRWLRIELRYHSPWPEAVDVLRPLMKAYL